MVSLGPVLIFAASVAAFLLLLSLLGRHRRRRRWKSFAREHGLTVHPPGKGRRMELAGEMRGRPVFVRPASTSSDTGDLGIEEVEFEVALQGDFPEGFQISEAGDSLEETWRFEPGEADSEWVDAYLTPDRRRALQRLMELGDPGRSQLRGARIRIVDREFVASPDTLRERLDSLLRLAPRLDA